MLPDRHLWDRWPPHLTATLVNQNDCYVETTSSNESRYFLMCDAVHSGKFYQIADDLGASTFRVEYTDDSTLLRDLPISVLNDMASYQ